MREATDSSPANSNYYKIVAKTFDGHELESNVFFATLPDTVAPVPPTDFVGFIDESGKVTLNWKKSTSEDIEGYRIYKSHFENQEPSSIHRDIIYENAFTDMEDLQTLNRHVYYYVMAIDRNQNHSQLSRPLVIKLPDNVPPQAPVLLQPQSQGKGIRVDWRRSVSDDVHRYDLLRKLNVGDEWHFVSSIPASNDSIFGYNDLETNEGQTYFYTVVAMDSSRHYSDPAFPVSCKKMLTIKKGPSFSEAKIDRQARKISLLWKDEEGDILKYRIYRKSVESKERFVLHRTVDGTINEFIDDNVFVGRTYSYFLVSVYNNLSLSAPSKTRVIEF
jgi:fibronectin type 3 domain-containing protein